MGGVAVVLYTFILAGIRLDLVDSPQALVAT
jgi:hypothetical protein